jgi:hypothetical protein
MTIRSIRFVLLVFSALLIVLAAGGWLSFMGFGIAYGDLFGVPGRERDLAELGRKAEHALAFSATCQAFAIRIASWTLLRLEQKWARISLAVILALVADLVTLALVKGI